jgi:hypothetical protein
MTQFAGAPMGAAVQTSPERKSGADSRADVYKERAFISEQRGRTLGSEIDIVIDADLLEPKRTPQQVHKFDALPVRPIGPGDNFSMGEQPREPNNKVLDISR